MKRKISARQWLLLGCLSALGHIATSTAAAQGAAPLPNTAPIQLPLAGRQPAQVVVQQSAPVPSGGGTQINLSVQGSYAGSIQSSETLTGEIELSIFEAIQRGLRSNLGIVSSNLALEQANAQIVAARSSLLPNVTGSVSENAAQLNLAAEGFSAEAFGGGIGSQFPTTVGPFHYYDVHVAVQQSLLDITALRNVRAERRAAEATVLEARQSREEVILAVTGIYLQVVAAEALKTRQEAEVAYADASYRQASAQVDAGNKAPIEANRSLVELQIEQQRLRAQVGEVRKRQIQLARLIGLPLELTIRTKEELLPLAVEAPTINEAVQRAWAQRQDLKASEVQVRSAEEARKAASAERLPSGGISGTYGVQGTNPNQGATVFQASASLSIPIYQGGRISADIARADAVVKQRRADFSDQRSSIEAEVRTAYVDLQVANDQVELSTSNRKLASDTLQQAQDRFSVGVADSVEVVNSQQALASADHDYVTAVFSQHIAKITLAHAMGEAEQDVPKLFERKAQ